MTQKLDSLSKIIIATGQINYMAVSIDSVNEQIKCVPDPRKVHADGIQERDEMLTSVWERLAVIMEDMADLINGQDCICPIDVRVSKVPFEILIDGKDDTEEYYEDDNLTEDTQNGFIVKDTDKAFADSRDAGDPECLCSRCLKPIPEEDSPVIRAFPTVEDDHGYNKDFQTEFRYCHSCCAEMGIHYPNNPGNDEYTEFPINEHP